MEFSIFDAHADTISEIYQKNKSLKENDCHVDLKRMKAYKGYTQVFAAFIDKKKISETPRVYAEKLIRKYKIETEEAGIFNIEKAEDLGKAAYSSILSIEGGEALEGEMENLDRFYSLGVRILTLTWNYDNEISSGADGVSGGGLTDFGEKVVERMNEIGMIVDASHISEKGFWDVAKISRKPFIASHSNVKKLCPHKRNLTDNQIREIIRQNGVIGINFYPVFLNATGECGVERIFEHIEYILGFGGENNVGFGSDFDGIDVLPDGVSGIESIERIVNIMGRKNYTDTLIKKILRGNFKRVIKACLK